MRPHWRSSVLLIASAMVMAGIDAAAEQPAVNCGTPNVQATFKATLSTYQVTTSCSSAAVGFMNWSSQGAYDPHTGMAKEDVHVSLVNGFSATATTTLTCPSDPWLGPPFGPGKVACSNGAFKASGQVQGNEAQFWLDWLRNGFAGSSLPNSTGFNYSRPTLIAQRDAALKAAGQAAAGLQKQNQQLKQALQPGPAVVAPTIVSPGANTLFMQNQVVPIKLLPPQGTAAASFLVKLERRDPQGNWAIVTNLPLSVAEATSPTGYTGWGAPGNGKGPAMIAGPGTYRVSAQVSAPHQTRWSQSVEFVVTTPNKAIQKGPKLFDQGGLR
ncbi:MAG: hypothetical protein QM771_10750 [Nitrospira sp.]